MIYRFYQREFKEIYTPPLFDYEVANAPKPVSLDDYPVFSWQPISINIRYALFYLSMFLLRKSGAKVRKPNMVVRQSVDYITINSDDLVKVLMQKLSERQFIGLARNRCMILIGAKEWCELHGATDEMLFTVQMRYGESRDGRPSYYFMDVPVAVLPDFVGVAVVPDFTGMHVQRLA